jgi:hypothetical protein
MCREALVWRQLRHPNVLPFIGLSQPEEEVLVPPLPPPLPNLLSPWMKHGALIDYIEVAQHRTELIIQKLVRIWLDTSMKRADVVTL